MPELRAPIENGAPSNALRSAIVPLPTMSLATTKCSTFTHSIEIERRFGCGPSASSMPLPFAAQAPNRPCRIPNWAWFSRSSLTFSPEPAELIADIETFSLGSSLTLTRVASATPTG